MPQSILYSLNLFLQTSRLSAILRFWLIIVLSFYDSMLLLYPSNVQICHMKSIVFLHPFLDLFVCCLNFRTCKTKLAHIDLYLDTQNQHYLRNKST